MAPQRADAVIAGVNKAGTTSLFVSLSTHPDVAPSAIKETRYFLPARYGEPLEPFSVYEDYFRDAGGRPVHLEATPSYVYGGHAVADEIANRLTDPHVILVLREPVARAISFFKYQKVRLRLAPDLPIEQYLATADRLGPDAFRDPENEKYMAFAGGCYADYLPDWLDTFGTRRLHVVWFEELVAQETPVLASVAAWLGIDPARFPEHALSSENRTTGFKSARLQQLALAGNDRLERVFRRHPEMKRRIRGLYYRMNGTPAHDVIPPHVLDELAEAYREPNERLAGQLVDAGIALPAWLAAEPDTAAAESA
ncbi:MAG TPA: sulfotransferase domain-containing protein [Acidimicrobiia bacterium]|nr:sulfotransferase domain-containing protein [Acidimicrobiia bacterium]